MKRRTRPAVPKSRLAMLFRGVPPLSGADSLSDADAWLAILQVRSYASSALDPLEVEAFNEYSAEFLQDRGLVEVVLLDGSYELHKNGLPLAGCSADFFSPA